MAGASLSFPGAPPLAPGWRAIVIYLILLYIRLLLASSCHSYSSLASSAAINYIYIELYFAISIYATLGMRAPLCFCFTRPCARCSCSARTHCAHYELRPLQATGAPPCIYCTCTCSMQGDSTAQRAQRSAAQQPLAAPGPIKSMPLSRPGWRRP
jgi:hypothetical protein